MSDVLELAVPLAEPLSEDAVVALFRAHRDRILGHAYGILGDLDGAGDVVQETFLRAAREPRLVSGGFNARAWLLRVAGNLALNRRREALRRQEREKRTASREPVRAGADPYEEVLRRQMGAELLSAMEALPAHYRRVLLLRYTEGLTVAGISELLETPAGTIVSWLHRARAVLRRRLGE